MTQNLEFTHQHFAHCESGVMSALLKHKGFELSEPMVFGLSGALCFAYLPFLKFGNMPLVSYRMFPGHIVKKFPEKLGISYYRRTYRDADRAMADLDDHLTRGEFVGLQTSAYHTTYFPPEMRFHFNAHNVIVIGKEGEAYLVSDPVFDHIERIDAADLKLARFAKGLSAPKGLSHYPLEAPAALDFEKMIRHSVHKTAKMMLHAPLPWIGIKGIRALARRITRLSKMENPRYARLFLGNVVRMQEEIGTGGGGFRFMYASFLQEAFKMTGWTLLEEASVRMTSAGDNWRQFALQCAQVVKSKNGASAPVDIAELLRGCADAEREIFKMLKKV